MEQRPVELERQHWRARGVCDDLLLHSAGGTPRRVGLTFLGGQPVSSCFGKHSTRFGQAQITENGKAYPTSMGQRHRNLIAQITAWDNLLEAYRKTVKGKRASFGYLEFKEYAQVNIRAIQRELQTGTYRRNPYREFMIYEPKARVISALDFKDRLVEHAICNVVEPILDATMLPYTYACRVGYGAHKGVTHIQAALRRGGHTHYLQTDFSKYFPSVQHGPLFDIVGKKIHCAATLALMREMLPHDGQGLPIGSLLSKVLANLYAQALDRMIHYEVKPPCWARYMDDIVVLGNDPDELRQVYQRIEAMAADDLGLKISRWQVAPISRGINFLGYRIWPTHKLLRKASVTRAKRKVGKFIEHANTEGLRKFMSAWSGHAEWADTHNLLSWMENRYGIAYA
ncbi:reverse transcriptase domain-containing protein [Bordetella hinzii]|uniref:reverse transcriptase domain-containing protein n=1 Tax=Bordetella hinzii TaxID=103855 RepID=UPI001F0F6314|nr:reverse transcriptase domain-containing protein [Bordetella hinzii]